MKISKREKILIALFIIVAIFIFWPENSKSDLTSESTKLTHKYSKIIKRFSKVHNLKTTETKDKHQIKVNVKRNIFKFGKAPQKANTFEQNTKQNQISIKNIEKQQQVENIVEGPVLPEINFKINGVIRTQTGNAVVISKSPEIFVIRENTKFFDKFIFKKVNSNNVILGYIGFEIKKIIPIENRGD